MANQIQYESSDSRVGTEKNYTIKMPRRNILM